MLDIAQGSAFYEVVIPRLRLVANLTCFDDELMLEMSKKAELLKPGAIVVTKVVVYLTYNN